MPMLNTRQYRSVSEPLNSEEEDSYIVTGYAMKYAPYVLTKDYDGNEIYEEFERTAFDNCDMSDVIVQYNHAGKVLARRSNGSLELKFDDTGLFCRIDLSLSNAAKELRDEIKAGLINKMSWGFMPGNYYYDRKSHTIHHVTVEKIFDVSAVSTPANNDTELYARSFADGVIDKALAECRERDKNILKLKLKLGGIN